MRPDAVLSTHEPVEECAHRPGRYWAVAALLTLAAAAFVLYRAWVADDAFITFRHVVNCLAGDGPVYNAHERVQAYSHPLWFLLLVASGLWFDVYAASIALGLFLTGLATLSIAWFLRTTTHRLLRLLFAIVVLLSSKTFVEFQTSGLESSLTNVLVISLWSWLAMRACGGRPLPLAGAAWLLTLLLLTRPDHLFLCAPVVVTLCVDMRRHCSRRAAIGFATAFVPLLAWHGFAVVYYGTPLPNTAYAKGSIPWAEAWPLGTSYVWDYCRHEPGHALLMAATILLGLAGSVRGLILRRPGSGTLLALVAGLILHLVYVTSVGGDFMRGRFLIPVLTGSTALAVHLVGPLLPSRDLARPATLLLAVSGCLVGVADIPPLSVTDCVRSGFTVLQYAALGRATVVTSVALLCLALVLAGTSRLRRMGGPWCACVFLFVAAASALRLVALVGCHPPAWSAIAALAAVTACSAYACGVVAAGRAFQRPVVMSLFGLLVAHAWALCDIHRLWEVCSGAIDDEYSFYAVPGWHNPFRHPEETLRGTMGGWVRMGKAARHYAEVCGPTTIACRCVGMMPYYAGPQVRVIDLHGLADPYVARGAAPPARKPGHTPFDIPDAYLQTCGAVNLLPNWEARLTSLDPTLRADAEAMKSRAHWPDPAERRRYQQVQLVVAGPLWSRERWRVIPAYMFPEHRRRPPWLPGESPQERFAR